MNKSVKFPAQVESGILSAYKNPSSFSPGLFVIQDDKTNEFLSNLCGLSTDENIRVINTLTFHFRWDIQKWEVK